MSTRKDPDGLKVLVIGIDGATFDLIKPWIEKGKLPTIRKLIYLIKIIGCRAGKGS